MGKQSLWNILGRGIVSVALMGWLAYSIDWPQLLQVLTSVKLTWITLAVVWIIISMLLSVAKWQAVLKAQGINLKWKELWQAYWTGLFLNNFLPSSIGGDAWRIYWVREATGDTPGAVASVVVERILATGGLALTGLMASFFVVQPDRKAVMLFLLLVLVSLGLLSLILWGHLPAWTNKRTGRLLNFLRGIESHGRCLQGQWYRIIYVGVLSVAFQVSVVGVNLSIFQALQISNLLWWDAFYIIPVTSVAAMLPVGINGYGLREGAYVFLLASYGVVKGTAFASSLLFAFLVSLCSLYGGWVWLNQRTRGEIADVSVKSSSDCPGTNEVRP